VLGQRRTYAIFLQPIHQSCRPARQSPGDRIGVCEMFQHPMALKYWPSGQRPKAVFISYTDTR
jgi:hypothetical protein